MYRKKKNPKNPHNNSKEIDIENVVFRLVNIYLILVISDKINVF